MILANCPSLSYIYIKDMIITYKDVPYQIQNVYTMKPYIYFNINDPYTLIMSNTMIKEQLNLRYICFNDKGYPTLVPQTDITISYSEDKSSDLVTTKIFGIKEELEEHGERFTTVQQDIEGIKTTVGTVQEDITGNTQAISVLQQKSDEISAEVSRVERVFNEDLESKKLRDDISVAILSLQATLGTFSSDMNTFMEDNKLTNAEKQEINAYKENVLNDRLNLISQIDILISALRANGQTDKSTTLQTQRDLLYTSIDNLINGITNACTDSVFTNSEMTIIVSYFSNVNTKINETKKLIDDYMFTSIGGELVEQIGKLIVTQNQIQLGVSRTESSIKNSLSLSKALVQDIISSNNTALVNFKNCFSYIVEDRSITSEEKDSLNVRINAMNTELTNLVTKKDEIISNTMLSQSEKNKIISSYNAFKSAYDSMINSVTKGMNDNVINDAEMLEINGKIDDYYNQLNSLHSSLCQGLDDIESNTISKEIADAKAEIRTEIDELDNKIEQLEEDVGGAIISGLVDEQEKANILQNLEILEREKIDIDNRFNEWYNSEFLYGDTKAIYKQVYDTYVSKYNALKTLSEKVANKTDLVTENERKSIDTATDELLVALDNFFKESEVVISTSATNEMNYIKSNLSKELTDVNNAMNGLNDAMTEIFADGIITEVEKKKLETILNQIDKEYFDITKTYEEIYNNSNLS